MTKNTTSSMTVTPINDVVAEDAESVTLTITPDPTYTIDLQNSATVTIRDDDAVNMVNVSTSNTTVSETTAGTFFFSRSGSTTNAVTVNYSTSGSATPGSDYTALTGSVTIAASAANASVTVTPVDDTSPEGTETVIVTALPGTGYGVEIGSATMSIADNDSGFVSNIGFSQASTVTQEYAGGFTINVTRTGTTTGPASVEYGVNTGTALGNGVDYLCPAGRLDFAAGETVKTISMNIIDDRISEDVESVTLQLRNSTNAGLTTATTQHTVLITDNEPRVTIEATDPFAFETGDTAQFTVRRYGTTLGALVVPVTVSGTATSGTDYTALPTTVTIPDGAASATLALAPLNNGSTEPVETVIVSLSLSSNSLPGTQTSATAYIDDAQTNNLPLVQIVSPKSSATATPTGVGLSIDSTVVDDGGAGSLTVAWSKFSGPGTVTYSAPAQADTDATFSASGTYVLRLTASDGTQTTTSDLMVTTGAAHLPWTNTDIGSVSLPGSGAEGYGVHSINGSGTSMSGSSDSFFLRSRRLTGDGEIRARVRYLPSTSTGARAGVMLRESTAAGSRMVAMLMAPVYANQGAYNFRSATGSSATSSSVAGITPTWWVRVARSGNNFSTYDSPDGMTWTQRGSTQSVSMATDVMAGIGVMSASSTKINNALVDNVTIIGTPENTAAAINAGADGTSKTNVAYDLDGTLSDDALPSIAGGATVQWTQTSGPGVATFNSATSVDTTATFPAAGTYVLRLTADDREVRTYDETTVIVTSPVVTIVANDSTATEQGLTTGQFTVARTGETTAPLNVLFTTGGTATNGTDYSSLGTQVTIPTSASSVLIAITPLADTASEGNETVIVTLNASASYSIGSPSAATVIIQDLGVDDWRKQQFGANSSNPAIAGDTVDPNNNGIPNLLEYALGLNPTATDGAGLPTNAKSATEFSLTYTRNLNAPDVTLSVEWSSNLAPNSWSNLGVTTQTTPINATRETVKASIPAGSSVGQRFLHLKAVRSP